MFDSLVLLLPAASCHLQGRPGWCSQLQFSRGGLGSEATAAVSTALQILKIMKHDPHPPFLLITYFGKGFGLSCIASISVKKLMFHVVRFLMSKVLSL